MRAVAGECGIALGTLYNYFSDKEELLISTISSIWKDLFQLSPRENRDNTLFTEYVETMFKSVRERISVCPDIFTTHSAVIANSGKNRALNEMERCTSEICGTLLTVLREDSAVSVDAFGDGLT